MAGDDPELVVEILADDGKVIGGIGTTAEPPPAKPPSERRLQPKAVIAGLALAGAVGAALVVVLSGDDDPALDPPGDPLPFLLGDDVDASLNADLADYPLFDREWDVELLVGSSSGGLEALDPNTGDTRSIVNSETPGFIESVRVIGDDVYINNQTEIVRIRDRETEVVAEAADDGFVVTAGNYWTDESILSGSFTLTHLSTGDELDLDAITRFVVAGDAVFASKGGTIVLLDAEGEERAWASGEIMGVARSGITWRECSQPDDCTYWAGSSDQPKRRKLDADAAASLVLAEVLYLSGFGGINGGHILSPSLQTAVSYQLTEDGDLAIHLTDLITGDSVTVEPTDNFPTFLSDESAVFVPSGNSIVAIDTATGTTQRILTHDGTLYGLLPDPAT